MNNRLPAGRSFESVRKEAKRWLAALEANDPAARARFVRAIADAPQHPTLRDVQHALAREHGFSGWAELKRAAESSSASSQPPALAHYEEAAAALLDAYRTGTPEAMERHYRLTWHRRAWEGMRNYVQLDLGKRPAHPGDDVEITLDDARSLVAQEHGFDNWQMLIDYTAATATRPVSELPLANKPVWVGTVRAGGEFQPLAQTRDWNEVMDVLSSESSATLHANGQMTDVVLRKLAGEAPQLVALELSGSQQLTDEGIAALASLQGLRRLNLSGTGITDRGLTVLRRLPHLEELSLAGTRITDAGMDALSLCQRLRKVNLGGTATGDGAVRALAGKQQLTHFTSGNGLTNNGLALLHELPRFKQWHDEPVPMKVLTDYEHSPNHLVLRGPFTDDGMRNLVGLDGLFALNVDDARLALTAAGMKPLIDLPRLGGLSADAKDDWMPFLAAMPHLRFLSVQDTSAGDTGFIALSASQSIEQIWGRRCHNLRSAGFVALSRMPRLRSIAVSCLNVDDSAVASLPSFPALRELMPMDIPDAGYRHIGKCAQLEALTLMYCRDTTDAATEHITGLPKLARYFASYTLITDRTPALLSTIDSLEEVTFDTCHGLTNVGIGSLSRLPRLRSVSVAGRGVTPEVASRFAPGVEVRINS